MFRPFSVKIVEEEKEIVEEEGIVEAEMVAGAVIDSKSNFSSSIYRVQNDFFIYFYFLLLLFKFESQSDCSNFAVFCTSQSFSLESFYF